jgi:hypothetical protein
LNPTLTLSLAANDLLLFPPEGVTPEGLRAQLHASGWQGRTVADVRRKALRALPIDYLSICSALPFLTPSKSACSPAHTRPKRSKHGVHPPTGA